ncbi:MAG: 2-oxoglutarate dehydrogenase E1 component [Chloroflexota bacterium]
MTTVSTVSTDGYTNFHGPNYGYILELYEKFQANPDSVDNQTQEFFKQWHPPETTSPSMNGSSGPAAPLVPEGTLTPHPAHQKIVAVANLAQAIRRYGFLDAQLDPLGTPPPGDPELSLTYHGLNEAELAELPCSLIGGPIVDRSRNSLEAIQELRRVYSSSTGFDFAHVRVPEEREWLRHAIESRRFAPPRDPINPRALLERLTQVEVFEHFLNRTFPGKTRFSIEGLDMLVPILDEIIGDVAAEGVRSILLGMAHRGRLNVLAHVLNKSYRQILTEFKDPVHRQTLSIRGDLGWTGDVKYHEGASRSLPGTGTFDVTVRIAPNPSHLELVNPIVQGMARADGTFSGSPGEPTFDHYISLPILMHGDAAFPGQGIVAETLNMARLDGYFTGGTIHIITNNQVGFTTDAQDSRSTLYASDLAKGFKIPIVHVNANDPVACMEVARLAASYRNRFQRDFLIDLIGYRRHGHNEGDEPRFTQPEMYGRVDATPTVRRIWATQRVEAGEIKESDVTLLYESKLAEMQHTWDTLDLETPQILPYVEPPPPGIASRMKTAISIEELQALHRALLNLPDGFQIHPRIERIMRRRAKAMDELDIKGIDWGTAEHLALASILAEGTAIRLTGEDVKRGTFSHRHAALYDVRDGAEFVPLHHLPQAKSAFEVHNSPLTENATVGYEYGYNIQAPDRLVIWEAQYGDFINGAQAVVDEYLVSGRAKWNQTPSLVLLLPHGYEGQGPDHSSARLERFLQSAAETNMRIANCTTAAQYFHLLRRQALLLGSDPLPLIVLTPKSLLRHPLAASSPRELSEGCWQPIIDDNETEAKVVRRLILCSGKVYVDLVSSELRAETLVADKGASIGSVAIARIEQIYPFPTDEFGELLAKYPNIQEVAWVQEEPLNMGAWEFARPILEEIIGSKARLEYVGRPRRANPAEGSAGWHALNQAEIVQKAFGKE